MAGALHQVGVSVSPVQVSTNIILVLSEASVILCEAEPCSHLERKINRQTSSERSTRHHRLVSWDFPNLLGCRCTEQSIWRSKRSPSKPLQARKEGPSNKVQHVLKCTGTPSVLTRQVLVHHVRPVFHKEAEHGGSPRTPLQPEQHRGRVSVGLRVRQR